MLGSRGRTIACPICQGELSVRGPTESGVSLGPIWRVDCTACFRTAFVAAVAGYRRDRPTTQTARSATPTEASTMTPAESDPRFFEAFDCVRRTLALVVGELVRLDKGERIDQDLLEQITQQLVRTAELVDKKKNGKPAALRLMRRRKCVPRPANPGQHPRTLSGESLASHHRLTGDRKPLHM